MEGTGSIPTQFPVFPFQCRHWFQRGNTFFYFGSKQVPRKRTKHQIFTLIFKRHHDSKKSRSCAKRHQKACKFKAWKPHCCLPIYLNCWINRHTMRQTEISRGKCYSAYCEKSWTSLGNALYIVLSERKPSLDGRPLSCSRQVGLHMYAWPSTEECNVVERAVRRLRPPTLVV